MSSSPNVLVHLRKIACAVIGLWLAAHSLAQTLDAPLKLVVPAAAGGATDRSARILFKNSVYDPQKDVVPVSCIRTYSDAVAVGPKSPVRDMKELIAWLKANPAQANFGVPALGSLPHLFALMIADVSKVSPQMIGYRGSAPVQVDLVSGNLPVAVDVVDALLNQHKAGKIRILAVSASVRSTELPEVPTLKEAGIDANGDG